MSPAKALSSLVLPLLVWLAYGAPNLSLAGNAALLAILSVHLCAVLWSNVIWSWFSADRFTYRIVGIALGWCSLTVTFLTGLYVDYSGHKRLEHASSIPPQAWAVFVMGIFATLLVPMLLTKHVTLLPKISERGGFENPTNRL